MTTLSNTFLNIPTRAKAKMRLRGQTDPASTTEVTQIPSQAVAERYLSFSFCVIDKCLGV